MPDRVVAEHLVLHDYLSAIHLYFEQIGHELPAALAEFHGDSDGAILAAANQLVSPGSTR